MNEIIRKIAEQSFNKYCENNIDLEKFADLIIRECAELFYLDEKSEATGLYIGNMIYNHFGIKK